MATTRRTSAGGSSDDHDISDDQHHDAQDDHDESVPLAPLMSNEIDKNTTISNTITWISEGHRRIRSHHVHATMRHITVMAALGGFLFGYDTGVISGALLPLQRRFGWTTHWEPQLVVSSTVLAAAVGSLCIGGSAAAVYGRRRTILLAAAIIGGGSIILAGAWNYASLIVGRLIIGVGIGIASLTTPIYIAEVATPSARGRLVTVNAFLVTLGQFGAGMVDGVFDMLLPNAGGWRWMLGLAVVPAAIMLHGFLTLPESPRWLAMVGRRQEASKVLHSVRESEEEAEMELLEILESMAPARSVDEESRPANLVAADDEAAREGHGTDAAHQHDYGTTIEQTPSVSSLYDAQEPFHVRFMAVMADAPTRRALGLGCGLMVVQQCSGINTVMYYAASIYRMSEFSETTSVWLSGFTALAQVIGIGISILLVDMVGRRELVLGSLAAVSISLMGLGLSFYWTRTSSEPVIKSIGRCGNQPSLVWDGRTQYCYDCTSMDGCGFCGGYCVPGDERAPFQMDNCPANSDWNYEVCSNRYGWLSCFFMIAYLLSFGIGMGGLPWTINSEIYPMRHRSLCVSISTAVNWIGNLLIAATFLSLSSPSMLTIYGAFWLYACIALLGFAWLYYALPETKGLHLEEIERLFQRDTDQYNAITEHDQETLRLEPNDDSDRDA